MKSILKFWKMPHFNDWAVFERDVNDEFTIIVGDIVLDEDSNRWKFDNRDNRKVKEEYNNLISRKVKELNRLKRKI